MPIPDKFLLRVSRTAKVVRIVWIALSTVVPFLIVSAGSLAQEHGARQGYTGDAPCLTCHQQIAASYAHTAHRWTSQLPSAESVHGSFVEGTNLLTIVDPANAAGEPSLQFRMEKAQGKWFETAITGFSPHLQQRRESIDIVTGSGKRGQTFLYWQGDQLFELPVSYWTDGSQWINSPGYDNGTANFSRPIHPACMECHASYLQPLSSDASTNRFDRNTFIPGIGCETCHGPGAEHVNREAGKPAKNAHLTDVAILNPARFSRDRQVDLCAQCHNGIARESLAPAFSYLPGKPLSEYFKPLATVTAAHPDVHGNQVALLERSRCFASSPSMSCSTCHDTHASERSAASYSDRCLGCHQWQSCGVAKKLGEKIKSNCIDCHMPIEQTAVIVSHTGDKEVHATMRNHWIKIYPGVQQP